MFPKTETNLEGIRLPFGDLILGNAAIQHIPCKFIWILPIIYQTTSTVMHCIIEIKDGMQVHITNKHASKELSE